MREVCCPYCYEYYGTDEPWETQCPACEKTNYHGRKRPIYD